MRVARQEIKQGVQELHSMGCAMVFTRTHERALRGTYK